MSGHVPLVGIVVLNYNGKDCLPQCLLSLQNIDYQRFFIVVVDNDSKDGSFEAAEAKFPHCSFLRLAKNMGFAAGMNAGITYALGKGADWVWVFNNDARAEKQSLKELIRVAETVPRAGLLSPWIMNEDGSRWFAKARIEWLRMRVHHQEPSLKELAQAFYSSECLTGCALLLSKKLINQVGMFDERFFLYYEDADLTVRAKEQGFLALVVPAARVHHSEQSEKNPQKLYFLVLSGLIFFRKHTFGWHRPYLAIYGTMRKIKNYFDIMRGRDNAPIVRRAYSDFYHGK